MTFSAYPCLLLAHDYTALRIIDFKHAFKLIYTDKAEIVTEFKNKAIRTVSKSFKLPAVIRLLNKFRLKFNVKLSRRNIFLRDNFKCRYCGHKGSGSTLTLDHVLPRSKGGKFSWNNIVTSCLDCNSFKGNKTLSESRMSIKGGSPKKMDMYEYIRCLINNKSNISEWEVWLPQHK